MATGLLIFMGGVLLFVSIIMFIRKYKLYKYGIVTEAKVVELETYSYVTPGPEFGLVYHTGCTPIVELEDEGKKTLIKYYSFCELKNYKVGDKFKVIYPKGKVEELETYSKFAIIKSPICIAALGVILIVISLLINKI